jgi:hypothetical protein
MSLRAPGHGKLRDSTPALGRLLPFTTPAPAILKNGFGHRNLRKMLFLLRPPPSQFALLSRINQSPKTQLPSG